MPDAIGRVRRGGDDQASASATAGASHANSNDDPQGGKDHDQKQMKKNKGITSENVVSLNRSKRNIRNIYYNTNEEHSQDTTNNRVNANAKKISTINHEDHQEDVQLEDIDAQHKQSKPQLPRNANIAGQYLLQSHYQASVGESNKIRTSGAGGARSVAGIRERDRRGGTQQLIRKAGGLPNQQNMTDVRENQGYDEYNIGSVFLNQGMNKINDLAGTQKFTNDQKLLDGTSNKPLMGLVASSIPSHSTHQFGPQATQQSQKSQQSQQSPHVNRKMFYSQNNAKSCKNNQNDQFFHNSRNHTVSNNNRGKQVDPQQQQVTFAGVPQDVVGQTGQNQDTESEQLQNLNRAQGAQAAAQGGGGHPYRVIKQNQVNFSRKQILQNQAQSQNKMKGGQLHNRGGEEAILSQNERQALEMMRSAGRAKNGDKDNGGKNSAMSHHQDHRMDPVDHIMDKNQTVNIYSSSGNFTSSQLITYNRIANKGKLNQVQNQMVNNELLGQDRVDGSQSATGCYSMNTSQNLKGKFYQTQVLQKIGGGTGTGTVVHGDSITDSTNMKLMTAALIAKNHPEATADQTYGANQKGAYNLYRGGQNSSQLSLQQISGSRGDPNQQSSFDLHSHDKYVLNFQQTQNHRTNSLEDLNYRKSCIKIKNQQVNLTNQKQLSVQKKHIIYRPQMKQTINMTTQNTSMANKNQNQQMLPQAQARGGGKGKILPESSMLAGKGKDLSATQQHTSSGSRPGQGHAGPGGPRFGPGGGVSGAAPGALILHQQANKGGNKNQQLLKSQNPLNVRRGSRGSQRNANSSMSHNHGQNNKAQNDILATNNVYGNYNNFMASSDLNIGGGGGSGKAGTMSGSAERTQPLKLMKYTKHDTGFTSSFNQSQEGGLNGLANNGFAGSETDEYADIRDIRGDINKFQQPKSQSKMSNYGGTTLDHHVGSGSQKDRVDSKSRKNETSSGGGVYPMMGIGEGGQMKGKMMERNYGQAQVLRENQGKKFQIQRKNQIQDIGAQSKGFNMTMQQKQSLNYGQQNDVKRMQSGARQLSQLSSKSNQKASLDMNMRQNQGMKSQLSSQAFQGQRGERSEDDNGEQQQQMHYAVFPPQMIQQENHHDGQFPDMQEMQELQLKRENELMNASAPLQIQNIKHHCEAEGGAKNQDYDEQPRAVNGGSQSFQKLSELKLQGTANIAFIENMDMATNHNQRTFENTLADSTGLTGNFKNAADSYQQSQEKPFRKGANSRNKRENSKPSKDRQVQKADSMRIDRNQINEYQKIQQPGGAKNDFKQTQEVNIRKLKADQMHGNNTAELMQDEDEVAYYQQSHDYQRQNQPMIRSFKRQNYIKNDSLDRNKKGQGPLGTRVQGPNIMSQSLNQSQLEINQQREASNTVTQTHKKQRNSLKPSDQNNQNAASISRIIVDNTVVTNTNPDTKERNLMLQSVKLGNVQNQNAPSAYQSNNLIKINQKSSGNDTLNYSLQQDQGQQQRKQSSLASNKGGSYPQQAKALAQQNLQNLKKKYMNNTGIGNQQQLVAPGGVAGRNTVATQATNSGANQRAIQRFMGKKEQTSSSQENLGNTGAKIGQTQQSTTEDSKIKNSQQHARNLYNEIKQLNQQFQQNNQGNQVQPKISKQRQNRQRPLSSTGRISTNQRGGKRNMKNQDNEDCDEDLQNYMNRQLGIQTQEDEDGDVEEDDDPQEDMMNLLDDEHQLQEDDLKNQIELLNHLQQMNNQNRTQLNSDQLNQLNKLLQIKQVGDQQSNISDRLNQRQAFASTMTNAANNLKSRKSALGSKTKAKVAGNTVAKQATKRAALNNDTEVAIEVLNQPVKCKTKLNSLFETTFGNTMEMTNQISGLISGGNATTTNVIYNINLQQKGQNKQQTKRAQGAGGKAPEGGKGSQQAKETTGVNQTYINAANVNNSQNEMEMNLNNFSLDPETKANKKQAKVLKQSKSQIPNQKFAGNKKNVPTEPLAIMKMTQEGLQNKQKDGIMAKNYNTQLSQKLNRNHFMKQAELENQVRELMGQMDQEQDIQLQNLQNLSRPKSSIAEMMANANRQPNLNQTQPLSKYHLRVGAANEGFQPMVGCYAITENNASLAALEPPDTGGGQDDKTNTDDQQIDEGHDEYQEFTDQLIHNFDNEHDLEQSQGYFKITGMLNHSQQDQLEYLNRSQIVGQGDDNKVQGAHADFEATDNQANAGGTSSQASQSSRPGVYMRGKRLSQQVNPNGSGYQQLMQQRPQSQIEIKSIQKVSQQNPFGQMQVATAGTRSGHSRVGNLANQARVPQNQAQQQKKFSNRQAAIAGATEQTQQTATHANAGKRKRSNSRQGTAANTTASNAVPGGATNQQVRAAATSGAGSQDANLTKNRLHQKRLSIQSQGSQDPQLNMTQSNAVNNITGGAGPNRPDSQSSAGNRPTNTVAPVPLKNIQISGNLTRKSQLLNMNLLKHNQADPNDISVPNTVNALNAAAGQIDASNPNGTKNQSQKKYKISKTTKNQNSSNFVNVVKKNQQQKNQRQIMNTLLNQQNKNPNANAIPPAQPVAATMQANSMQQKQKKKNTVEVPLGTSEGVSSSLVPPTMQLNQQKKLMTQKLQIKDNFNNKPVHQKHQNNQKPDSSLNPDIYAKSNQRGTSSISRTSQKQKGNKNSQGKRIIAGNQMLKSKNSQDDIRTANVFFTHDKTMKGGVRVNSENKYGGTKQIAMGPPTAINLNGLDAEISEVSKRQRLQYPLSLMNTYGNLRENLRGPSLNPNGRDPKAIAKGNMGSTFVVGGIGKLQNMARLPNCDHQSNYNQKSYQMHSGNRSSLQVTLKGGMGIMQNLSNVDNLDNLNTSGTQNDLILDGLSYNQSKSGPGGGGVILNIENVLNQIQMKSRGKSNPSKGKHATKQHLNSSHDPQDHLNMQNCMADTYDNEEFKKIQRQLGLLSPTEGLDLDDPADPAAQKYEPIDPMEQEYDNQNLYIDNQEREIQGDDEIGYDIINIQKTKDQFYQVQPLQNLENQELDQDLREQTQQEQNINALMKIPKNNKTQPLPKQIIRAAKEINDQGITDRSSEAVPVANPGGRVPGAGKKQTIKIQKQDIHNINRLYNRNQENARNPRQLPGGHDTNQPPTNIEDIRESLFGSHGSTSSGRINHRTEGPGVATAGPSGMGHPGPSNNNAWTWQSSKRSRQSRHSRQPSNAKSQLSQSSVKTQKTQNSLGNQNQGGRHEDGATISDQYDEQQCAQNLEKQGSKEFDDLQKQTKPDYDKKKNQDAATATRTSNSKTNPQVSSNIKNTTISSWNKGSSNTRKVSQNTTAANRKTAQLDLQDNDKAGSRIPGGDSYINSKNRPSSKEGRDDTAGARGSSEKKMKQISQIEVEGNTAAARIQELGEMPKIGNKKRVEYINKLKEDLDDKIGKRFTYTNLQQKNNATLSQSNNNLILIDHNSAYNPSQVGDNDDGTSQSTNRVHNYIFGRQIGEGAYAVVRMATSREDNQKYAIKVYDKTKLSDINRQRSVRREVVLLQKMDHPNIVKLIEAFETDSHVYLVMENVAGGSLHSYLKEMINKQLDEEEARRIFKQILTALKYCHSKCIAHRDIKLENVLLDEKKDVKLIDFGFSTCIPNHKKIRMFCGTPSYMAPQIVSKVEYAGPPADIWATGVLLYALLNGCFPFRGQTDEDLYRRIKRGTYHIYNQKVTREYLDILQRCVDVNDDTRPSAQDLLDDPWFQIEDIKQRAYEEEKRQFKARILAKVPIIKKNNHTICILAQNPNEIGKNIQNNKNDPNAKEDKEEAKDQQNTKLKKPAGLQGLQILNSNDKQVIQINQANLGNLPYSNNKEDLIISDYGLHSGMVLERERERARDKQGASGNGTHNQANGGDNAREGFPRMINLNQQHANVSGLSGLLNNNQGQANAGNVNTAAGGAIVLSYGAALAPQIQINNINNLNLINSNMKKKLNHEAYQAYYNTSSSNNCISNIGSGLNGINMNIQSSPVAGAGQSSGQTSGSGGTKSSAVNAQDSGMNAENNVYGQPNPVNQYNPTQGTAATLGAGAAVGSATTGGNGSLSSGCIIMNHLGLMNQYNHRQIQVTSNNAAEAASAAEANGGQQATVYNNGTQSTKALNKADNLIGGGPTQPNPSAGQAGMTSSSSAANHHRPTGGSGSGAGSFINNHPLLQNTTQGGPGSRSQSQAVSRVQSIQSSPYSSAYQHQIVNNQMAQLHQLQQEQLLEQQMKEKLEHQQKNENILESGVGGLQNDLAGDPLGGLVGELDNDRVEQNLPAGGHIANPGRRGNGGHDEAPDECQPLSGGSGHSGGSGGSNNQDESSLQMSGLKKGLITPGNGQ